MSFYRCKLVPGIPRSVTNPGGRDDSSRRIIYFNPDSGMVLSSYPDCSSIRAEHISGIAVGVESFCAEFYPDKAYTFIQIVEAHQKRGEALEVQKDLYEDTARERTHLAEASGE